MAKKKKTILSKHEMVNIQDAITGEVEQAKVSVYVQRDIPKYKSEKFTLLFQLASLSTKRDLSPSACKLALILLDVVEYGNVVNASTNDMAELCGYSKRQTERALNELVNANVLTKSKHPVDGRMTQYHLNPYFSWKGTVKDRKKYIKNFVNPDQLLLFPEPTKALKPSKDFE